MSTQSTSKSNTSQNASSNKGTQGGSHEQHVKAGQQSHKNTAGSGSQGSGSQGSSSTGSSNSKRGFASMDPEKQREIASEGGRQSHSGTSSGKR